MKIVALSFIEAVVRQSTSGQMLTLLLMNQIALTSAQFHDYYFISKISYL